MPQLITAGQHHSAETDHAWRWCPPLPAGQGGSSGSLGARTSSTSATTIAPGYQKLREQLQPARFVGMTATPVSPTGGGLGRHFDDLVLGPDPAWLMEQGFLCRYKLYGAPAEIDTEGVTVRAGEYALNELEERVTTVQGNVLRDWHGSTLMARVQSV